MGTLKIRHDDPTQKMRMQAGLYAPIFYSVPFKIFRDEWIPNIKLHDLRNRKKLCLVLDLDHTLLHTKQVQKLSSEEIIRLCNSSQNDDISRWESVDGVTHLTKLRPFVRTFLEEASKLFDLYIYTNGSRYYAKRMARLLDPDCVYFGSRIIGMEDSTKKGRKRLDVVPVKKSGVLILDDSGEVWPKNRSNLVVIKKYDYFAPENPNGNGLLHDEGTDESESSGPLNCALRLLQDVHRMYFESNNHLFDVKELLGILLKNNGTYEEKLPELVTGKSWRKSRKRLRVEDECSSRDVTKRSKMLISSL
ncbi:RNA polymerase II C-terminal domain phosphatase-like [Heracleum sosnowskyi]|uniref:RNA polymerase II C-terminal domain phosphatase-like n=1 Tax=Heracleum sosnowskyi TaxID=360622 RepID=A0AAD8J312_9APIA|nr:RNA polymerase II C-terminal domain phosphatase-like [Heracleum sosnowskyi]